MLFLVYADSYNYAGCGQFFVVEAPTELDALDLVEPIAEEYFLSEDSDQLEEDEITEGPYSSVHSAQEFNEDHPAWKYYINDHQAAYYTKVNL